MEEIASYLGRGVRTVQRYERELSLPVRRRDGTSHSAVIALTTELDEWLRRAPLSALNCASAKQALPHVATALHGSLRESENLRQRCHELRSAHSEARRTLLDAIRQMKELLRTAHQARENLVSVSEKAGRLFRPN